MTFHAEVSRAIILGDVTIPTFLYGTAWKEERTQELARTAMESGFLGIDTANQRKHYHEEGVGMALLELRGRLPRPFLQTKFTHRPGQDHRLPYDPKAGIADQVSQSFESSLAHLHTDFIDSYLLHGPSTVYGLADEDWSAWRAMETIQKSGAARLLGVSNVNLGQLRELWEGAAVKPTFVQNRCFARTGWDFKVRVFCQEHGIRYQGFSLLTANDRELRHPLIGELSKALKRTVSQLVFRFALQAGMIPLTGTSDAEHMNEDLKAYDFTLTPEQFELVEKVAALED